MESILSYEYRDIIKNKYERIEESLLGLIHVVKAT